MTPRAGKIDANEPQHASVSPRTTCATPVATRSGLLAMHLPPQIDIGGASVSFTETLSGVFAISALPRLTVAVWFTPHVAEIRPSSDATVNQVIYRFARFNPVAGVVMDVSGAGRRRR